MPLPAPASRSEMALSALASDEASGNKFRFDEEASRALADKLSAYPNLPEAHIAWLVADPKHIDPKRVPFPLAETPDDCKINFATTRQEAHSPSALETAPLIVFATDSHGRNSIVSNRVELQSGISKAMSRDEMIEFTALHELGHAVHRDNPGVFSLPYLTAEENKAAALGLFDQTKTNAASSSPYTLGACPEIVFSENFADAYAAWKWTSRRGNSPQSVDQAKSWALMRERERAYWQENGSRPWSDAHHTSDTLKILFSKLGELQGLPEEQALRAIGAIASQGTVLTLAKMSASRNEALSEKEPKSFAKAMSANADPAKLTDAGHLAMAAAREAALRIQSGASPTPLMAKLAENPASASPWDAAIERALQNPVWSEAISDYRAAAAEAATAQEKSDLAEEASQSFLADPGFYKACSESLAADAALGSAAKKITEQALLARDAEGARFQSWEQAQADPQLRPASSAVAPALGAFDLSAWKARRSGAGPETPENARRPRA